MSIRGNIESERAYRNGNIDIAAGTEEGEQSLHNSLLIRMGMILICLLILLITGISAVGATTITVSPGESIQDAIDSLPHGGGIVELAPGVHDVNDTIVITRSNVTIIGTNDSEIRSYNSSKDIFSVNVDWEGHPALDNITFSGFKVTSTYMYEWNPNSLIRANNVNNLTVEGLYDSSFIRTFVSLNWGAWGEVTTEGLRILNNTIQNSAMTFVFCKNATIAYNTMTGTCHSDYAIAPSPGNDYVAIHDNYIDNVGVSANIRTESLYSHIYSNICKGSRIGISARYVAHDILIENNTISGTSIAGIQFYSNYGLTNQTARNNIIYDCPGDGVQIAEIAWATATGTSDVNLLNNVIYNCGGDGIGRGPKTESFWIVDITNNIIVNNTEYGINLAHENITETHSYNDIWNNTLGGYNGTSAGTGGIAVNPLFANPANGDFHLKSTGGRWNGSAWITDSEHSLCIDTGDPASDYSNEPSPNGGMINMGAYGNTEEASKSPPPTILSSYPLSPVRDVPGATRTFNITINQIVNVSWQINGAEVQTNESVTEAAYTNTSAAEGTWNVSVAVSNPNGTAIQTWIWKVGMNKHPVASYSYLPGNPVINQTLTFNATNSTDPDGTIINYAWNFGDGTITNTTDPIITHAYASAGTYAVNLTVTDDEGATNATTKFIDISGFGVDLSCNSTNKTIPSGGSATYNITVKNTGNTQDTLILELPPPAESGWSEWLDFYSVELDPNESTEVILTVSDGVGLSGGIYREVNVIGTSQGDPAESDFVTTNTTIEESVFDTGSGTYPCISGTHIGTITPNQTITVQTLYTYSCAGTGGHTEYARLWNSTLNVTATGNVYAGDWHNITFNESFTLVADETYNYSIRTGSYPQIIHNQTYTNEYGTITSTNFTDANGRVYYDWIPAIRME